MEHMNTQDSATDLATGRAVAQLRAYGEFLADYAEAIVGDIDAAHVVEGGIYVSFTLCQHDTAPTLSVTTDYLVQNAV